MAGFEPFRVTIPGEPAVQVGSGEKAWKEKVRAKVEAARDERPWGALGKRLEAPLREDCTLELKFYMSRRRLYELDLDNLLKPAIDALGTAIFPPGRTGKPYDSEDVWVRRIMAEKLADDQNPRLEITVTPWEDC